MANFIAGTFGGGLLLLAIVSFGLSFSLPVEVSGYTFFGGILLVTASLGAPLAILDRLDKDSGPSR